MRDKFWRLAGLAVLIGLTAQILKAEDKKEYTIEFKALNQNLEAYAEEKKGKIWVDVMKIAEGLGADISISSEVYKMDFSSKTMAINSKTSVLGTLNKTSGRKKQKWSYSYLKEPVYVNVSERLLTPLEALPDLFERDFSYHLQRRALSEVSEAAPDRNGFKAVTVRSVSESQKTWISVQDLAKALGAIQYPSQPNHYKLVLANFTILELQVGQTRVSRRQDTYAILEDPVLLYSGSPFVTLSAIKPLFGVTAVWDAPTKTLLIAAAHEKDQVDAGHQLKYIGYKPENLSLDMEELSFYYQDPSPTYSSEHSDPYESARDFASNNVIRKETPLFGKMSGTMLPNFKGSVAGAPFAARGIFEKLGEDSQLVNGNIRWGFPKLQASAGRDYVNINGLNNQFDLVDQAAVSHSNDWYGDNSANPQYNVKAFYGQTFFSIYMSSSLFSQTVDFRQKMSGVDFELNWMLPNRHRLGFGVEQYLFENKTEQVSSNIQEQDFLVDLFGDDLGILITPQEQSTLTTRYLTDRHLTTVFDTSYKIDRLMQASAILGLSHYKDYSVTPDGTIERDVDYKLRNILGTPTRRVDVSYERVGPKYRSIGNPLRYQDKEIVRVAPYLDLTKVWKLFGEFRREDAKILTGTSMPSYSNIYLSAGNFLNFEKNSYQVMYSQFESTLSGKRRSVNFDWIRYFGRDTLDLGGGWSVQETANGSTFRKSYTGKASYQILREDWRASLAQELTQHVYDFYSRKRWESVSSLLIQRKSLRALLQYEFKPKYFLEDVTLYTGYLRIGQRVRDNKSLNLFVALTSREASLKNSDVWRVGFEWLTDFN